MANQPRLAVRDDYDAGRDHTSMGLRLKMSVVVAPLSYEIVRFFIYSIVIVTVERILFSEEKYLDFPSIFAPSLARNGRLGLLCISRVLDFNR